MADAAPAFEFDLVGNENFPETNVVRAMYVNADNLVLEGYSLRVTKDGVEQTVSGESWGGQPGMTWPIPDERQRFQNYKVSSPAFHPPVYGASSPRARWFGRRTGCKFYSGRQRAKSRALRPLRTQMR